VSAPYTAVQERLIQAVQALIVSLLPNETYLPNLTAAQVLDLVPSNVQDTLFPCIFVGVYDEQERFEARDTQTFDYVFRPVLVAFLNKQDPRYPTERPPFLLWRESLMRSLRPTLSISPIQQTVPEAVACVIEPRAIIDKGNVISQYFDSGFLLVFRCVEQRGLPTQATLG
jgi:hypothetical protein